MKRGREKRVNDTENRLKNLIVSEQKGLERISFYKSQDFRSPENLSLQDFEQCSPGFKWSRNNQYEPDDRLEGENTLMDGGKRGSELALGDSLWFRLAFTVPERMSGESVFLRFSVRPENQSGDSPIEGRPAVEALCYRNETPWKSFDQGHDSLLLTKNAEKGEDYELLIEVGTTLFWGGLELEEFELEEAKLFTRREVVEEFHREFRLFNDLRKNLDEGSVNREKILAGLHEASKEFPFKFENEEHLRRGALEAKEKLEPLKNLPSEISDFKLTAAGHAHLDAAWLWPWSETIRKCGRTSSTALKLLEEYSEYRFLFSQPALYEFIRKHYPDLFDKISNAIEAGKWEPVGGTWVESDVNLSGGEPLARQYLYGKRYFRQHFDVDPKITFLPDAFGFSAALPGIARAAGCPYLFTHKLSWNETNEFPHHSFNWEGIDGSRLLTHFPPADTYNGMSLNKGIDEVTRSAREYKEKEKNQEAAYLIGWGDGGGGPNRDMIEDVKNIREMDPLPDIEFDSLKNFFTRLKEEGGQIEEWYGELYLERHRGTFTTQSKVKRKNRELEFLLRESEFWSALGAIRKGFDYPKDQLENIWKSYLFNQFHDILPGSSIREVYVDAERDYEEVESIGMELLNEAKNDILPTETDTNYLFVGNSLSWKTDRVVSTDVKGEMGDDIYVETEDGAKLPGQISHDGKVLFSAKGLPGTGGKSFKIKDGNSTFAKGIEVTPNKLENEKIKVTLDERGEISSIFDKDVEREVVSGQANQLVAYIDIPTEFEAWELEEDIYEKSELIPAPDHNKELESGPVRGVLEQKRSYKDSLIDQRIKIFRDSKRLDFQTEVDWHEEKVLLKSQFPVNVRALEATYEVQFGHFKRATHENTTWDKARFEVPHQKWVDVSEYGFGAALLNNGKYGVNVEKSKIGLSLLRAPKWPDPEADMGHQEFSYSFLPHSGDFRQAGVIEEAYDFNAPIDATPVNGFLEVPPLIKTSDRGVVVESIKLSQDSDRRLVVRLYEAWGRENKSTIDLGFQAENVVKTNLIEDELEELDLSQGKIKYDFDPFEIVTLGIDF